jgi:YggT family protein
MFGDNMSLVITIINSTVSMLTLLIFIYSLLGFFLSPFHPVRRALGQVIEPLLAPIRRVIPPVGGFDFSLFILMIILQVLGSLLTAFLRNFI